MQNLTLGYEYSTATGINNAAQVVGYAEDSDFVEHAFLYSGGSTQVLGTLPGYVSSMATGMDRAGQVVGYAGNYNGTVLHAFLYSGGSMQYLGTLPGWPSSLATGINAGGQVVGRAEGKGSNESAFLLSGGTMHALGTLSGGTSSSAYAINDGLGRSWAGPRTAAAMSTPASGTTARSGLNELADLPSGWDLQEATGINDSGQICGLGISPTSDEEAFLLTPIPNA